MGSMPEGLWLTSEQINEKINGYGFIEISDIGRFLALFCGTTPCWCDYIYIRAKLAECLLMHDDQSEYFIPLRELACDLDCLVYDELKVIY